MTTSHNEQIKHHTNQLSLEISEVFYRTSKRFEKVFLPLLALHAIALVIATSIGLLFLAIISGLYFIFPQTILSIGVLAIFALISFGCLFAAYCAVPIMSIYIIHKPNYDFQELFRKSLKQVPRVFTILALVGLAELGGFLLGILPGIWLSIILQFVFFILVLEHKNHKESISTSVFLVKDNFWKIFCYVIILAIIGFLIGTIPFFGFIFGLLYGFFVRTFIFELYKTLTHNKITNPDVHHTNKNIVNIVYLFASFAVLVLVVLLTALIVFVGLLNTNSNIANNYDNRFETIIDQPYK